jgi:Spy/CpxP family protein refolding chaperone
MANQARLRASLLLAAVLAAGVTLGWFANDEFGGSRRSRPRSTERLVERLTKDLSLTPAQRDSVRVILERRRVDIDSLWTDIHPRFEAVRARTHAEVERVLTPEQQQKYRERNERREKERREKRSAPR